MVMMDNRPELSPWEIAARSFEPRPRRWATPGDMAVQLDNRMIQTPALRLIDQALVNLADGIDSRIAIFMGPQEGKSERCSHYFPLWVLSQDPDTRVAIVSHSQDLAYNWGWLLRQDIATFDGEHHEIDLGLRLHERPAQGHWRIRNHHGGIYCTGVSGSLAGRPVDLMILDDPIKDLEQANSIRYRDRAWRFWQAVGIPRLGPNSKVVLMTTRWHEDDIAGRILQSEGDKAKGGKWRVVSIPARCEDPAIDPLGRKLGEYQISARGRTQEQWREREKDAGAYVWCTPAETPIMMADWTTKPISHVQPGDLVMGYRKGSREARLELIPTSIEAVSTRQAPVHTMRMQSGTTVRCTAEHRWYTGRNPDKPDIDRRYPTHVLRPRPMYAPAKVGTRLHRFDPVIPELTPQRQRLLDYLAGMIDGEGTWQSAALTISQSPDANPETFEKIHQVLTQLGYRFTVKVREHPGKPLWGRNGAFVVWDMRAVAAEMLRRTDMAKHSKALAHLLARPHKPTRFRDRVEEITPGDAETVYALQTGTGNYVAWGYASSNSALFQQRPAPAEGGVFKRLWWRYWTPAGEHRLHLGGRVADLRDCWRFATVDLAASTRTSADYTVISAWARTLAGDLVLLDRLRAKIGEEQHFAHARTLVEQWKLDTLFVEKSQQGYTLVREATQAGVPISPLTAEQDKLTRALPASAWCSGGRVWLPASAWWLDEWRNEAAGFPAAAHDDQVDTLAYAVRVAVTEWVPLVNRAQQATAQEPPPPDPFGGETETDFDTRPM